MLPLQDPHACQERSRNALRLAPVPGIIISYETRLGLHSAHFRAR
jgi:hypothetical protein